MAQVTANRSLDMSRSTTYQMTSGNWAVANGDMYFATGGGFLWVEQNGVHRRFSIHNHEPVTGLAVFEQIDGTPALTVADVRIPVSFSGLPFGSGPWSVTFTLSFRRDFRGDDVIQGSPFDDRLHGYAGADRIIGGDGNDRLDGGGGIDALSGGPGDDIYVVDNEADTVSESADEGTDTVLSRSSFTLDDNVETLVLRGRARVEGTGNELDNTLIGNGGANVLRGGPGNDLLDGRGGADTLIGDSGDDTFVVAQRGDVVVEEPGQGTDAVEAFVSHVLGPNIENLTLLGNALRGTGNELDNILVGNARRNLLDGGAGADTLDGGTGNDRLAGGDGNDRLTGGAGADRFDFTLAPGLSNVDTIWDFQPGKDHIALSVRVFGELGSAGHRLDASALSGGPGIPPAADPSTHLLYDTDTGALYYDADGGGPAAPVQFALLEGAPTIDVRDFVLIP